MHTHTCGDGGKHLSTLNKKSFFCCVNEKLWLNDWACPLCLGEVDSPGKITGEAHQMNEKRRDERRRSERIRRTRSITLALGELSWRGLKVDTDTHKTSPDLNLSELHLCADSYFYFEWTDSAVLVLNHSSFFIFHFQDIVLKVKGFLWIFAAFLHIFSPNPFTWPLSVNRNNWFKILSLCTYY